MLTCYIFSWVRLRLTGYLLDLVDDHEGVGQAHLHRVVDGADLRHLNGDLGGKETTAKEVRLERLRGIRAPCKNTHQ